MKRLTVLVSEQTWSTARLHAQNTNFFWPPVFRGHRTRHCALLNWQRSTRPCSSDSSTQTPNIFWLSRRACTHSTPSPTCASPSSHNGGPRADRNGCQRRLQSNQFGNFSTRYQPWIQPVDATP